MAGPCCGYTAVLVLTALLARITAAPHPGAAWGFQLENSLSGPGCAVLSIPKLELLSWGLASRGWRTSSGSRGNDGTK